MKRLLVALATTAALIAPAAAQANAALIAATHIAATKAKEEKALLERIEWIVENSGFSYNGEPLPTVKYMTERELKRFIKGNEAAGGVPYGAYDPPTDTLILREDLVLGSWAAEPTVIHELVHYLQDARGEYEGDYCFGELEVAAYSIEKKWVKSANHPEGPPDPFTIIMGKAACRTHHP